MKVSQLLHVMDKDEAIVIIDENKPIMQMRVFSGLVRWLHKDNPLNRYHISLVTLQEGELNILVKEQRKKGE